MKAILAAIIALCLAGCAAVDIILSEETEDKAGNQTAATQAGASFWRSSSCRGCHARIYNQYAESMHHKSYSNPLFQAQYFKELLPAINDNKSLAEEAKGCSACHTPVMYIKNNGHIESEVQGDSEMAGITCDFCHTMTGHQGKKPGNGNYISTPGDLKYGPLETGPDQHQAYSEFFSKSEFCAVCHNSVNRNGLEIKATFTEWKDSVYAKKDIQCQDCHMNIKGYLTEGKATFESGTVGSTNWIQFRQHEKLYTHRFPGAHDKKQVEGAMALSLEAARSGDNEITVHIIVDNSKSGHKMPTGSAELRLLWVELKARMGDTVINIPADSNTGNHNRFDITGGGSSDREIIGTDIPDGSRIYRIIMADKEGKHTLSSYKASQVVFDNRLNPAEIRRETYRFKIPPGNGDRINIVASLNYLSYPSSFGSKLGVARAETVNIYTAEKSVALR